MAMTDTAQRAEGGALYSAISNAVVGIVQDTRGAARRGPTPRSCNSRAVCRTCHLRVTDDADVARKDCIDLEVDGLGRFCRHGPETERRDVRLRKAMDGAKLVLGKHEALVVPERHFPVASLEPPVVEVADEP
jgi:hypothetical protein